MGQTRIVGCRIAVPIGVIAVGWAVYMVFEPKGVFDALWGDVPLINKADEHRRLGDLDGALRYANRAVSCFPDSMPVYLCRAKVLEARGDLRESIQDYTKAASLGYHFALADRGRVYEKLEEFDKAAASYCEVLQMNRGPLSDARGVALHRVMGPGEYDIDRHPDAVPLLLKFFDAAIERNPNNEELRECRELILQRIDEQ